MKRATKIVWTLSILSLSGTLFLPPVKAQTTRRGSSSVQRRSAIGLPEIQTVTIKNNYNSSNLSGTLNLPFRRVAGPAALLVTGDTERERSAAAVLTTMLTRQNVAVLRLETDAYRGSSEDADLNIMAALEYLKHRPDIRPALVGIIGYGNGISLAELAASQPRAAAFAALLGGNLLPDRQVPEAFRKKGVSEQDALTALRDLHIPTLVVLGEYDTAGTHHGPSEEVKTLQQARQGAENSRFTIRMMPAANGWLQDVGREGQVREGTSPPLAADAVSALSSWIAKEVRANPSTEVSDEVAPIKPVSPDRHPRIFGLDVLLDFPYHPEHEWRPAIGGQTRPYGFWYW